MTFKELGIIDPILRAIEKEGYVTPSPIQSEAIPLLLQGRDLLGCAQTGTGKTAAFAVPILQTLYNQPSVTTGKRKLRALVLTPTRELAIQIAESFRAYGRYTKLRTTVLFGGVSQVPQVAELNAGPDILVATPGRLIDLINQKLCSLNDVSVLVLDEADRMLDMGFIHDVQRVIDKLPTERQTLLFSATVPQEIATLSKTILRDPVTVAVTPVSSTVEAIDQYVYLVDRVNKGNLLIDLLGDESIVSALIFSRTKHGADKIQKLLAQANISAKAIHGNKSQNARQDALADFKAGRVRALVATDIAARGIDVEQISHVINYDLPNIPETYVHRIGRTGRAGLSGIAISFCDFDEKEYLADIEKLIKIKVPVVDDHPYPMQVFVRTEPKQQQRPPRSQRQQSDRGARPTASATPNPVLKQTASASPRPVPRPGSTPSPKPVPRQGGSRYGKQAGRNKRGNI
ncbi:MAG: DEAD/DEAH box helicase [Oscillospiraceae bacterium]|jgi:ATP-dependent RNA helicase RhlE|nr:DEAD/DEAH box helicase [Oscillospiraceae bacterium]